MSSNNTEGFIKVNAYSGYKANERPLSFSLGDLKIEIIKIIDQWTDPDRDFFRVQGDDGWVYTLSWDREKDIWAITKFAGPVR